MNELAGVPQWSIILTVNTIVGVAAFISSLAGFGFGLTATPFLVILLPPQQCVPVMLISWLPLSVLLCRESYSSMSVRRIGSWLGGALLGIPMGAYVLAQTDVETMRWGIGSMAICGALFLWCRPNRPLRHEGRIAPLVGFCSGAMGGASGMAGPPVVIFGLNQGWDRQRFRADLIGYLSLLNIITLFFLRSYGIVYDGVILLGLSALPGLLIGYCCGIRLKDCLAQEHFRRLALVLITLGGFLSFALP